MYPKWYTQAMLDYAKHNQSFAATISSKSARNATGKERQLLINQGIVFERNNPVVHYFWVICDRERADGDKYSLETNGITCPYCLAQIVPPAPAA